MPSSCGAKKVSIPQAVWIACNGTIGVFNEAAIVVSIPQAVWIACNLTTFFAGIKAFQYRKRYGLHAMKELRRRRHLGYRFNTASGMDCMQFGSGDNIQDARLIVSIPQAVWIACNRSISMRRLSLCRVSIPQAVWIACNIFMGICGVSPRTFQYRKRYGLHAISRGAHYSC